MKRRTNKIKKMMTAGLVCTTMILTVGCAEQTVVKEQEAESLPVIVVGSDNYPPFNYLNADGDTRELMWNWQRKHFTEWDMRRNSS